jgi:hypothetical protein
MHLAIVGGLSLSGLVLDVINIAVVIAGLVLLGAVIMWFADIMGYPVPANVQKFYLLIVFLVGLYMFVSLLFGIPSIGPLRPGML